MKKEEKMLQVLQFSAMLGHLKHLPDAQSAVIYVHDTLDMARVIAADIYGPRHWRRHVIEVYGLLVQRERTHGTRLGLVCRKE